MHLRERGVDMINDIYEAYNFRRSTSGTLSG